MGFVGFGLAHTLIGKYRNTGWIYTAVDSVALGTLMLGSLKVIGGGLGRLSDFRTDEEIRRDDKQYEQGKKLMIAGGIALGVSRLISLVDLNIQAANHNDRYQELTGKKSPQVKFEFSPPVADETPGFAGVNIKF